MAAALVYTGYQSTGAGCENGADTTNTNAFNAFFSKSLYHCASHNDFGSMCGISATWFEIECHAMPNHKMIDLITLP